MREERGSTPPLQSRNFLRPHDIGLESMISPCQREAREDSGQKTHWCSVLKAALQQLLCTWHIACSAVVLTLDAGSSGVMGVAPTVPLPQAPKQEVAPHSSHGATQAHMAAQAQGLVVNGWYPRPPRSA